MFVRRQKTLPIRCRSVAVQVDSHSPHRFSSTSLGFFVAFGTFFFYCSVPTARARDESARRQDFGRHRRASRSSWVRCWHLCLARRMRPTRVIACGFVVAAVGFLVLTQIGRIIRAHPSLCPPTSSSRSGWHPCSRWPPTSSSEPRRRAGRHGSGAFGNSTELGGAVGIAILGSIVTAVYRSAMASTAPLGVPSAAADDARDTLQRGPQSRDRQSVSVRHCSKQLAKRSPTSRPHRNRVCRPRDCGRRRDGRRVA